MLKIYAEANIEVGKEFGRISKNEHITPADWGVVITGVLSCSMMHPEEIESELGFEVEDPKCEYLFVLLDDASTLYLKHDKRSVINIYS